MTGAPRYFATPEEFRAWLAEHHETATELLVGFRKVDSGLPSLTWPQSVDEALCHGWIDGIRKRVDDTSYTIRFTPRKPGSNWSKINIARVAELGTLGRMRPAGIAAFECRAAERTGIYAYEQRHLATLDEARERRFRADRKAWGWFEAQAPSYRRTAIWHIVCAKQEATRDRRLEALIAASARGERLF